MFLLCKLAKKDISKLQAIGVKDWIMQEVLVA